MTGRGDLKLIRRLWPVVVACGLIAAGLMWAITPVSINTERKVGSFTAIATLLVTPVQPPSASPTPRRSPTPSRTPTPTPRRTATPTPTPTPSPTPSVNTRLAVHRVALLVRTGEVPLRAAEALGYAGNPADLVKDIGVRANDDAGVVTIRMQSKESAEAVERVNAFAHATVDYLRSGTVMPGVRVTLLEEATALPNEPSAAFVAPPNRLVRTLVAGGLGILFGLGLILAVEVLGARIRTRQDVATALSLPVFAEIAATPRRLLASGGRRLVVLESPHSVHADGYRSLKAAILHAQRQALGGSTGAEAAPSGQVVLLTPIDPDSGVGETVANLAMAIAIDELRVLVIDADLRRPGLNDWFDVADSEGVVGYLGAQPPGELKNWTRPTLMPGVSVLGAGPGADHSAYWVSQFPRLIAEARRVADVVLVAASPILAASEIFDLAPLADTVVVVVRSGRLGAGEARRLTELLTRFPQAESGAVLIGTASPTGRRPRR